MNTFKRTSLLSIPLTAYFVAWLVSYPAFTGYALPPIKLPNGYTVPPTNSTMMILPGYGDYLRARYCTNADYGSTDWFDWQGNPYTLEFFGKVPLAVIDPSGTNWQIRVSTNGTSWTPAYCFVQGWQSTATTDFADEYNMFDPLNFIQVWFDSQGFPLATNWGSASTDAMNLMASTNSWCIFPTGSGSRFYSAFQTVYVSPPAPQMAFQIPVVIVTMGFVGGIGYVCYQHIYRMFYHPDPYDPNSYPDLPPFRIYPHPIKIPCESD